MAEETFYEESLDRGLKFILWEGHGLMRRRRRSRVKKWFICKALARVISLLWCGWEWHKVVEINGKEFTPGSPEIVFWSREAVLGMCDDEERGKAPPWAESGRAACQCGVSKRERVLLTNCWEDLLYFISHTACRKAWVLMSMLSLFVDVHVCKPAYFHARRHALRITNTDHKEGQQYLSAVLPPKDVYQGHLAHITRQLSLCSTHTERRSKSVWNSSHHMPKIERATLKLRTTSSYLDKVHVCGFFVLFFVFFNTWSELSQAWGSELDGRPPHPTPFHLSSWMSSFSGDVGIQNQSHGGWFKINGKGRSKEIPI